MQIDDERYRRIEAMISSEESPVGIDARKTHVIILAKLEEIEARLAKLERATTGGGAPSDASA